MANVVTKEKVTINREAPQHYQEWKFDSYQVALSTGYQLVGGWQSINGTLTWVQPAASPVLPGCFLQTWEVEPFDSNISDTFQNCKAKVTATYAKLETSTSSNQDYGEESIELGTQEIDLPSGSYSWTEGDKNGQTLDPNKDARPRKQFALGTYKLKITQQALDPIKSLVVSLMGTTNNDTLNQWPQGTLMYQGVSSTKKICSDGTVTQECSHNWAINCSTWGKLFDGTQFSNVTPDLYTQADHTPLLPVQPDP